MVKHVNMGKTWDEASLSAEPLAIFEDEWSNAFYPYLVHQQKRYPLLWRVGREIAGPEGNFQINNTEISELLNEIELFLTETSISRKEHELITTGLIHFQKACLKAKEIGLNIYGDAD